MTNAHPTLFSIKSNQIESARHPRVRYWGSHCLNHKSVGGNEPLLPSFPIFRFAVGTIGDLDVVAAEFNQSIYSYLKVKYGTLKGTDKVTTRGTQPSILNIKIDPVAGLGEN